MRRYAEAAAAAVILLLAFLVGIRHVPCFAIETVELRGKLPRTASVTRILSGVEGENRFRLPKRRIENELEDLPYVLRAEVKVRGKECIVHLTGRDGIMLIGEQRELFTDGNMLERLPEGDAEALEKTYFPLSLERGRCVYLEEFGLTPEFQRVTALMLELSGGLCYNVKLMSRGSYRASDGPGFGTLTIESDPLGTGLVIKEDLSAEYLLALLEKLLEEGPSDGFRHQTYEIKENTLKMRKEG